MRCDRHVNLLEPRNVERKIDRRREDRHVAALKQALLSSGCNASARLFDSLYIAEGGDVHGSHAEVHASTTHGGRITSERDVAVNLKLGRAVLSPHMEHHEAHMQSKRRPSETTRNGAYLIPRDRERRLREHKIVMHVTLRRHHDDPCAGTVGQAEFVDLWNDAFVEHLLVSQLDEKTIFNVWLVDVNEWTTQD